MLNNLKLFFNQYRKRIIWGGTAAILLVALSITGVYLYLHKIKAPETREQTIPVNVDTGPGPGVKTGGQPEMLGEANNLSIQLSEGKAQPQEVQPVLLATGEPLSEEEIQLILDRLPGMAASPEDQVDFKLAQDPIPPPRTGETVKEPFPPTPAAVEPQPVEAGPLEVLRYAPEGEIPVAPFVSVTFNQPMVPLGTLAALAEQDVPVQLEPSLPGTWRWLGTRTLTFEYDSDLIDRLPKATRYQITVPAGTKSAVGGELAQEVTWNFTTPPAKVTNTYPYDAPQPLQPVFFIAFDQRIDAAAVLETIRVSADGQPVSLKLASQEEIQADLQVKNLVKNTLEGRWLAFKAAKPLPADAGISVTIGPNTPSAEGPLLSKDAQVYTFRTYAPLKIVDHGCSWGDQCPPLTPFFIRFNNPIDTQAYQESMLRIEPEVPGVSVNIFGDTVNIQGATKGQTTYTVTISGSLQDAFGQTLGKDEKVTFRVGPAEKMLVRSDEAFVTLDPVADKPVYSVYTINYNKLDVQIYAVQPSDWPEFRRFLQQYQYSDQAPSLPGKLVYDKTMNLETPADTLSETSIDLSQVMDGDYGQFIIVVAPPTSLLKDPQERFYQTIHVWVQVTQIGLDAFMDNSQMVAWATSLQDGSPLAGVKIQAGQAGIQGTTGADGISRFPIPSSATYLVATQGADQALLPRSIYYWGDDAWSTWGTSDELRWYVFDDRQMYRPGEEVHLKGWMRRIGGDQNGDVGLVGSAVSSVSYQVTDPQGNSLVNGRADVNALGGFDFLFTIPNATNLGNAQITLQAEGSLGGMVSNQYYHNFQIQEFRRPEFEVNARNETAGPYFTGGNAVVAVEAKYYAGDPLPNADVSWVVTSSPSSYSPPNWPDFTFGTWQPWWFYYETSFRAGPEGTTETFTGKTDASGEHFLRLDFNQDYGVRPVSVLAEATVMDVNRQAWASSTSLLVHPADLYVGLRSDRYFVERGTPLKVDLIVTDLDGKPVIDRPVEVQAARLEWKYQDGLWQEVEADVQTCKIGSQDKPVTCTFETPIGGTYRITASVTDAQGRMNQSQFTRWVSGGQMRPSRKIEQEQVTLIPDKQTYQPGDVAHILVQSPFSPAEGLLTVSRSGILYTQPFQIEDGSATLDVPIEEKYIPNLNIQVDLVGAAPRTDDQGEIIKNIPPRPAYATGQMNLSIPPLQRTLALQVKADPSELEPGGETTVSVILQDANGKPVPEAELAVVVVDEAILALTNYQLADPVSIFYSDRPSNLSATYGRSSIVLIDPLALAGSANAREALTAVQSAALGKGVMEEALPAAMPTMTAAADMSAGAAPAPIRVRLDFNPLAIFAPGARTDANGEARLEVKLPDNLTRYRVMVVAVDQGGKLFGSGEANLTARLPLMVRPAAPRFLNFGDQFELPVVLQNQTDEPLVTDVVLQATNLELTGSAGLRVTVPAHDRIEVRFPVKTDRAGTARFQVAAVSGTYADAATVELPVYTPATTEAFAVYGVIDEGAVAQPVSALSGVFPQYGGLEINTSSTALQALTDAVLYLVSYPFECSEQLSSRILAVAALRDVLSAFEAEGLPSPEAMQAAVDRDIARLQAMQNDDGGLPYWRRGFDSIPFNTIHAAHALYRAKSKGFDVPQELQQRALEYLRQVENYYPTWYGQQTRWTLSAYALYVRNLSGDRDPEKALRLLNEAGIDKLPMEAIGWLWPVLEDAPGSGTALESIRQFVNNHVVETAGAANFTTAYDEQTYLLLSSDRRTDAILLDALIGDEPQSDLIPKLVNGLLAHRTRGRWENTQENVFVLLALDRYFNTFEKQEPDFVARIWLGEAYVGSTEFQGRTTERHETDIPMSYLMQASQGGSAPSNLILSKEGTGRLYYRLGLRYSPTDLKLDPLEMGFVVQRVYEAVDNPEDVTRDADGTWHIRLGARVRVSLTMVADNRRYHVALVDPLPAGLEIINPALAVSGSIPQDPSNPDYRYGWWWWGTWYEHQNMRDERAEAFTSLLWDGTYTFTYVTRATTPGTFVAPPAKAEEMYSPEVFGRSGSDLVIVK